MRLSELSNEAKRRDTLLGQLVYLIDEVEAQKAIIHRVPPPVLSGRPYAGVASIREMYGQLIAMDEQVYLPCVERMVAEAEPVFASLEVQSAAIEEAEQDEEAIDLLNRVQQARTRLLQDFRALPLSSWSRQGRFGETLHDVFWLAYQITQHDAEVLRAIGYRLYESNLSQS